MTETQPPTPDQSTESEPEPEQMEKGEPQAFDFNDLEPEFCTLLDEVKDNIKLIRMSEFDPEEKVQKRGIMTSYNHGVVNVWMPKNWGSGGKRGGLFPCWPSYRP